MEKRIEIIAALEFLSRGIVNPKADVLNFTDWLHTRAAAGEPINHPEMLLPKWRTKAENTIVPTDGAKIAELLQAIECNDLDTICGIRGMVIEGAKFVLFVESETIVRQIENCLNDETIKAGRAILAKYGAKDLEYRPQPAQGYRPQHNQPQAIGEIVQAQEPPITYEEYQKLKAEGKI